MQCNLFFTLGGSGEFMTLSYADKRSCCGCLLSSMEASFNICGKCLHLVGTVLIRGEANLFCGGL